MTFYIIVILSFFLFLSAIGISDNDLAFAKINNSSSQKNIEICCTWGDSINDGELTFSITNGGSDLAKIVKMAINDWEKALGELIQFKYTKEEEDSKPDIKINFKKDKGNKVGKSVTFFDTAGYIDHVEISISKKSDGFTLEPSFLEHVAKHEFGHALGLGHAQFPHSLMYPDVDETLTKISACELDSVVYANHLNSNDDEVEKEIFHPLDYDDFECKE
ncbi:MAG: matrixin family metalloprotease [Nitrososphaeraceae archaeon]